MAAVEAVLAAAEAVLAAVEAVLRALEAVLAAFEAVLALERFADEARAFDELDPPEDDLGETTSRRPCASPKKTGSSTSANRLPSWPHPRT